MEQKQWLAWEQATREERSLLLKQISTQEARVYVRYLREQWDVLPADLGQELAIFLASMHYQLELELLHLEEAGRKDSSAYQELMDFYGISGFLIGMEEPNEETAMDHATAISSSG
ncbi:hypothetical protein HZZ02_03485 [Streptococcus danieliae]|nr:hypothetical protein [Streptococcus danieliae]